MANLIPVEVRGGPERPALAAELNLVLWSEEERLRHALKLAGYCWLGAVFGALIPLAHFVLVPGLLIAGPIVFFRVRKQLGAILESAIVCPECGGPARVPPSGMELPLETVCPGRSEEH